MFVWKGLIHRHRQGVFVSCNFLRHLLVPSVPTCSQGLDFFAFQKCKKHLSDQITLGFLVKATVPLLSSYISWINCFRTRSLFFPSATFRLYLSLDESCYEFVFISIQSFILMVSIVEQYKWSTSPLPVCRRVVEAECQMKRSLIIYTWYVLTRFSLNQSACHRYGFTLFRGLLNPRLNAWTWRGGHIGLTNNTNVLNDKGYFKV